MRQTDSRWYLASAVSTALLLLTATLALADGDNDSLTFGVFPYLPTTRMEQIFAPIAARFGELTGRPIRLRSRPDYARFREQVKQQAYDILFVQPFDYVRVAAPNGYIPLARWVATDESDDRGDLSAIMVARPDAGIEKLQDLQDRTVAVPNLDAAVSLLGRYALRNQGVNAHIRSAGNHLACLQQVQVKRAAACITAWPPVKLFEQKNGVKFKLVYQTRIIPSSLFAVQRRIPAEQLKLLRKELLSWRKADPATAVYLSEGAWTRLYPATDKDYDIVREIWTQLETGSP
ncbi:MAG: phosphate/phosphite/phosphonate ABC transporter substrate-binding protein [Thiogranum sp.]|nr:phosphate/phosphite/phosphonate ABC transporter substrate-binding protein [Thiogranum sp.]